jgi:drug/metabolite transporter (DMT)-like permease
LSEKTISGSKQVTTRGLTNLFIVYLIWGSTYLAIRVAVRPGAGIPPFTLGMVRTLIAGGALLLWGILRKGRPRLTKRDLAVFATSGILMWTIANGMVIWAEQRVESSLAAVLIATTPLWTVAIESFVDRQWPHARVWVALFVGFSGTVVLSIPEFSSGDASDTLSIVLLILAPITWSMGILLQRRHATSLPARVSSGFQMVFAGLGFAVLVLLAGEGAPQPTHEALLALVYLTLFGSIIAFTSFVSMVRELPTSLAMTYAYINPVIAVILGAWLLSESVTVYTLIGTGLVLLGVIGVFRERAVRG